MRFLRIQSFIFRATLINLILLLPAFALQVSAQQSQPLIKAQITQISGQTLYLDAGRNQGISTGDTLTVYDSKRNGHIRGRLRVVAAISQSCSVEFLSSPFSLTRGEQIYFSTETPPKKQIAQNTPSPDSLQRKSVMNQKTTFTASTQRVTTTPIITGRIMTGGYLDLSRSRFSSLDQNWIKQTFASPFVNLMLRGRRLPDNMQFDVNMRWSYRYLEQRPLHPTNLFSIYNIQLSKKFKAIPLLTVSVGRFYNRYEEFSGFWDGAMIRYGSYDNGIGVITGFEPSYSSEGFSSSLPKHSVFAYASENIGPVRSSSELSLNAVYPRNGWMNHLYWGIHQDFRIGRSIFSGSVQVDRDPMQSKWRLTQGYLRGRLDLIGRLSANVNWLRQQPYQIWQTGDPISYSRTSYGGGLSYDFSSGYLASDVSIEQNALTRTANSYNLYGSLQRTPLLQLGFTGHARYWSDHSNKVISAGGGLSRWFGQKQIEFGYDFYRTDFFGQVVMTHSITAHLYIPFTRKMILDLQARTEIGKVTQNESMYLSIWYNF